MRLLRGGGSNGRPASPAGPLAAPLRDDEAVRPQGDRAARPQELRDTLDRARDSLLGRQHADGHWRGLLATNVTMDAEDLLLREFLGIRDRERSERSAVWIRSQQNDDGSWSNFAGGPGDLSTTIEAYWALKLTGDDPEAPHMALAAGWSRERGGPSAARVFTQIWMALFGLWPWDDLPALPPELVLLPRWVPLNPYDFAAWARQTIVALTIVRAHQPVHPLPFGLEELGPGAPASRPRASSLAGRALERLDRLGRAYERLPFKPLRGFALGAAERWVLQRQEADGGWGGIQPPWVYSLLALRLQGYPLDHPVMRTALDGIDSFTVEEDGRHWLEACQSPVWDTALAIIGLADAGIGPDDPALLRAGDWLLEREVKDVRGDWAIRKPELRPGGWSFEYHNVNYPDLDDASVCALALRRLEPPDPGPVNAAVHRAVRWIVGMESRDGAWGAFDADNVQRLCRKLPFCDFGEVIDPPSADVTAHVIELLATEGVPESTRRGLGLAARRAGARRLVVRPVGRQPHLRHMVGAVRPGRSWDPGR